MSLSHTCHTQVDKTGKPELVTADETDIDASVNSGQLDASRVNQTPERSGYQGYLIGDGLAPNGEVFGHGISFPTASVEGDYFLRTDFQPNRLFRFDSRRWVKVEDAVRHSLTNSPTRDTHRTSFVNNTKTTNIGGDTVIERQAISKALKPKADN